MPGWRAARGLAQAGRRWGDVVPGAKPRAAGMRAATRITCGWWWRRRRRRRVGQIGGQGPRGCSGRRALSRTHETNASGWCFGLHAGGGEAHELLAHLHHAAGGMVGRDVGAARACRCAGVLECRHEVLSATISRPSIFDPPEKTEPGLQLPLFPLPRTAYADVSIRSTTLTPTSCVLPPSSSRRAWPSARRPSPRCVPPPRLFEAGRRH